jgi:preprotein translocase subunit SecA
MDSLREGIGLRAYGQRDPLIEYKREAFGMFSQMIAAIEEDAVATIFKLQPASQDRFKGVFSSVPKEFSHPQVNKFQTPQKEEALDVEELPKEQINKTVESSGPKVGRNDHCPCGSGKKYKKCCGK